MPFAACVCFKIVSFYLEFSYCTSVLMYKNVVKVIKQINMTYLDIDSKGGEADVPSENV